MQDAARLARQVGQRRRGLGHGAGRARRLPLLHQKRPALAGHRQSRGLGHARRSHFLLDKRGRVLEAMGLGAQLFGGEEACRNIEMAGHRMERGLVGLHIDGGNRRQGLRRETLG